MILWLLRKEKKLPVRLQRVIKECGGCVGIVAEDYSPRTQLGMDNPILIGFIRLAVVAVVDKKVYGFCDR